MKNSSIDGLDFQKDIFQFIEEIKEVLSTDIWSNILLNCSKNEVMIFWLLYRKGEANMTEIAEYIHVPLNTATGIIDKMEKQEFITRNRSKEDKRVVIIELTEKGNMQVQALADEITYYATRIIASFSKEEMELFYKMAQQTMHVLKQERKRDEEQKKVRKIEIQ